MFITWHVLYVMQFEVNPIKLHVNDLDMHVFVPVWLHIEIRLIQMMLKTCFSSQYLTTIKPPLLSPPPKKRCFIWGGKGFLWMVVIIDLIRTTVRTKRFERNTSLKNRSRKSQNQLANFLHFLSKKLRQTFMTNYKYIICAFVSSNRDRNNNYLQMGTLCRSYTLSWCVHKNR